MNNYAPQYTKKEKIIIVLKAVIIILPFFLFMLIWGYDWTQEFFQNTCDLIINFERTKIIIYLSFVVLPGVFCLAVSVPTGLRAIKMLKQGQTPLPGEKVFSPTPYRYGRPVRVKALFMLIVVVMLLISPIWLAYITIEIVSLIEGDISALQEKCS